MMNEDPAFEEWFMSFNPSKELNKYQINNIPLQHFLIDLQNKIGKYFQELTLNC